jgi:hypothetical protein
MQSAMATVGRSRIVAPVAGNVHGTPDAVGLMQMKDIVLIGVAVAFFALSWIYARSFDRL